MQGCNTFSMNNDNKAITRLIVIICISSWDFNKYNLILKNLPFLYIHLA